MSKVIIDNLAKMNISRAEMIKNGFSPQKYDDVCRGRSSYKINEILEISEKFQLSLDYLLKGIETHSPNLSEVEKSLLDTFNKLTATDKARVSERAETLAEIASERAAKQEKEHKTEQNGTSKCLPLNGTIDKTYYSNAACAGTGLYLDEASAETLTVRSTPEALAADFAIPISGNSMEDEYHSGDIVLVESCPCVRKGEVGIFLIDGEVCIKEYGGRFLISYNPKYDPIDLSKHESVFCLGRVIGVADVVS